MNGSTFGFIVALWFAGLFVVLAFCHVSARADAYAEHAHRVLLREIRQHE